MKKFNINREVVKFPTQQSRFKLMKADNTDWSKSVDC